MDGNDAARSAGPEALAGLIEDDVPRALLYALYEEIVRFSDDIDIEIAPFEIRFSDAAGFRVTVSAYRKLFGVSAGGTAACTVRVSSRKDFIAALDLCLHQFLESRSRADA
jgi:hypothetical protein